MVRDDRELARLLKLKKMSDAIETARLQEASEIRRNLALHAPRNQLEESQRLEIKQINEAMRKAEGQRRLRPKK